MKLCKTCGLEKPYNPEPALRDRKSSGFQGRVCWTCWCEYKRIEHQSPVIKAKRVTPEGKLASSRASIKWNKANQHVKTALQVKYIADRLQRTPKWADLDAIKAWYEAASIFGFTVDHVYPLRGKLVSGLHVHNNLQLLTRSENSAKGNRI